MVQACALYYNCIDISIFNSATQSDLLYIEHFIYNFIELQDTVLYNLIDITITC